MPGQRVEVVLLVVVDRRFLAHAPVDLPRAVEELLGERVEDDFGCGHIARSDEGIVTVADDGLTGHCERFLDLLLVLGRHFVL